tara:strand:- start:7823 stop:8806 length:984 start_codon:yes stop_codon:yes gene_type:complete
MLTPKVTLLLVTKDCQEKISKSLNSYKNLDFDLTTVELIFIDGCSKDSTLSIIEDFKKEYIDLFHSIRVIQNKKVFLASGWNLGIKASRADFVLRIDAHSQIAPNYLSLAYDYLAKNNNIQAVGGVLVSQSDSSGNTGIAKLVSSKFGTGGSPFRGVKATDVFSSDTAVFALYRRSLFSKVGYFNEDLDRGQDIEFHSRVIKHEFKLVTNPLMRITHFPETRFWPFHKKAMSTSYWALRGGKARLRHLIPMLFVLYILFFLFALAFLNTSSAIIGLPLYLYVFVLVYFSIKDRLYLKGYLFLTYHLVYGFGSIKALPAFFRDKLWKS